MKSNDDLTAVEFRVYEFGGEAHSAFVQLTTDYGDTLPFAFICVSGCTMLSPNDDYRYTLEYAPQLTHGSQVTLRTSSVEQNHENVDEFTLGSCSQIRNTQ